VANKTFGVTQSGCRSSERLVIDLEFAVIGNLNKLAGVGVSYNDQNRVFIILIVDVMYYVAYFDVSKLLNCTLVNNLI
jgi:hypothetical protein